MLNILTIFLVFLTLRESPKRLFVYAFVAGLATDLYFGGILGLTSIFNLILVLLISLFKSRFAYNWRWAILFVILAQVIWFYAWRLNF